MRAGTEARGASERLVQDGTLGSALPSGPSQDRPGMARPGMVHIDRLGQVGGEVQVPTSQVEWTTSEEVRAQDRWLNRAVQRLDAGPTVGGRRNQTPHGRNIPPTPRSSMLVKLWTVRASGQ